MGFWVPGWIIPKKSFTPLQLQLQQHVASFSCIWSVADLKSAEHMHGSIVHVHVHTNRFLFRPHDCHSWQVKYLFWNRGRPGSRSFVTAVVSHRLRGLNTSVHHSAVSLFFFFFFFFFTSLSLSLLRCIGCSFFALHHPCWHPHLVLHERKRCCVTGSTSRRTMQESWNGCRCVCVCRWWIACICNSHMYACVFVRAVFVHQRTAVVCAHWCLCVLCIHEARVVMVIADGSLHFPVGKSLL